MLGGATVVAALASPPLGTAALASPPLGTAALASPPLGYPCVPDFRTFRTVRSMVVRT